ncbi:MAG: hypothetical protein EP298_05155 [Gammaproteobacteria bacterium]|nr:MAG: hypothetical protein EP298_05155 [Gammaproteobacteria bacterium]UTW42487.1 hypothetical protein KFE69_13600 [bacterium SCSIO 12844]
MCLKLKHYTLNGYTLSAGLALLLLLLLTLNFNLDLFNIVSINHFKQFNAKVSQNLVIDATLEQHTHPNNATPFGLGRYQLDQSNQMQYIPYRSQIGIQGIWYSFIYNQLGASISMLHWINSTLTAISILLLVWAFYRIYDKGLALAFLVSVFFSPWMVLFARNLYWVSYLWFLPVFFSFLAYSYRNNRKLYSLYLLLFALAVFIKSAAGYEYLSAILLFASMPFVCAFVLPGDHFSRLAAFKAIIYLVVLSLVGFMMAIIIHAYLIDNNIILGLKHILIHDVERRTYGNPMDFSSAYTESLDAPVLIIVLLYFFWFPSYPTPLLYGISGAYFKYLLMISLFVAIYHYFYGDQKKQQQLPLLIISILSPLSWFVLAKAHSYIHTHLNFVLWYFGTVAMIIYILGNTLINMFSNAKLKLLQKISN